MSFAFLSKGSFKLLVKPEGPFQINFPFAEPDAVSKRSEPSHTGPLLSTSGADGIWFTRIVSETASEEQPFAVE
ncbi:MAG: hypothetical protein NVSMB45_08470 [Ginsengibacter sp.]